MSALRPRTLALLLGLSLYAAAASPCPAQTETPAHVHHPPAHTSHQPAVQAHERSLATRLALIMARPEFRHAFFGLEFYSLDKHHVVYALNADKLFTPGSTTKLLTEGTALELFGSDYRFHTRVYRTGNIARDGTLEGDLVFVAGGDPNLSGRPRRPTAARR